MKTLALQIDGMVGPTHHYAGLSHGNVACMENAHSVANPRKAALEGLKKMRFVADLGVPQAVMPPQSRPALGLLRESGFSGNTAHLLESAYRDAPALLAAAYSASFMWTANAATVSPAADTEDGKMHFTPANLVSTLHRALEPAQTGPLLKHLFPDEAYFVHHPPLRACSMLADEGAANHMRLVPKGSEEGLHLFAYGASAEHPIPTRHFPARQRKEVAKIIARQHGLKNWHAIRQHPEAIDAGVFHNDVIAMSEGNLLIHHEQAFAQTLPEWEGIDVIKISSAALPLADAVRTYFFNSQLIALPEGGIGVIAPAECAEDEKARAQLEALLAGENGITRLEYADVRESMKNGGGPACLRLRIPIDAGGVARMHQRALMNSILYQELTELVSHHYRDRLTLEDLRDPALIEETQLACEAIYRVLQLPFPVVMS